MKLNIQLFGGRGAGYKNLIKSNHGFAGSKGSWLGKEFQKKYSEEDSLVFKPWFVPDVSDHLIIEREFSSKNIVSETEKAILIKKKLTTKDGEFDMYETYWAPKAAVMTYKQNAKYRYKNHESYTKNLERLIKIAKKHGIKATRNMKYKTVAKKLDAANIKY